LFSANVLPRSPDDTYAFYSRWILIEFQNIFSLEKGTADPDLEMKLTTAEELSGLLNLALAGLKRLRENGWRFSYKKTVEDVEVMYKRNANPVLAFLMDACEAAPEDHIEKTILQQRFNEYARKHNIRPLSTTTFAKLLKDQTEIPISDIRPWGQMGQSPGHGLD
jgi:putative DNA primase/helicase